MFHEAFTFGCLGISIEVMFTGFKRLAKKHWHAEGVSYVWMWPVYALSGLGLQQLHRLISNPAVFATVGMVAIYGVEALVGLGLLKLIRQVPWDYKEKGRLRGTICPSYAHFWWALCFFFAVLDGTGWLW